jgi:ubiquinone/menaquinone biosynthesis C-methylase UbiE
MNRIMEPELMEEDAQARAYVEADFEEPHSNFIRLFREFFGHREILGYVLDLGCGPGDISFRFARAYRNCTVHGIDGSEAMLGYGRKILSESNNIEKRVKLIQGRLPGAILQRAEYDAIISNSLLHHLHDPHVLWETIRRYALPEAPVFVMDLKRPGTASEARSLAETYAGNEPEILQRDFYNSLLASFEVEEVAAQLEQAGLGHLSVKEVSDRHLVVSGMAAS